MSVAYFNVIRFSVRTRQIPAEIFAARFSCCPRQAVSVTQELVSLRKSLQIYRGLVEVSGLINSITDYDELLRAILDVARRVIRAEAASLFLVNEQTADLDLIIASYQEGSFEQPKIHVPRGQGIAGWVFEHGESLLIRDAYADPRFYRDADRATGFRTRSILCAPLKRDERVTGVLQVLNPTEKDSFESEDLEGFVAYSNLIATAIEKLRTIDRILAQERVERDLAIAAEIQVELLSRAIPDDLPGAIFAAYNQPAQNVGGDFFSVFARSPEEIYFAIGDVSGKGISASLLMAQTLSAMQFVFAATTSPANALTRLNETLHERIVRGMFVTTLVGRMMPSSRRVEIASAGHCKPYLVRAGGGATQIETEGALPLGILPQVNYRQARIELAPGDCLFLFTDGLSESQSPESGKYFDEILPGLLDTGGDSPGSILDRLVRAERTHRGDEEQRDDLTVLVGAFA
jgi:sigma-B regulation protein RsbU (phosphoserine phosphatase)